MTYDLGKKTITELKCLKINLWSITEFKIIRNGWKKSTDNNFEFFSETATMNLRTGAPFRVKH